ncbi:MAG: homocysteine S-methyltransferase family protein [Oscillospiraceae bacterium]|jgi:5-methyltetrahydrofolate--homocysteine methyltransferase|nr:homocysteine S-methyltransferase family protein [Oscillospiraceae bacterium]
MFLGLPDGDFIFFDGAMGTMLQKRGLPPGQRPDVMNITAPEAVLDVHRQYRDAGSGILCTNTFGANARALRDTGYSVREIVSAGVDLARRAAGGRALTALDLGPVGELLTPCGELTEEDAYALFREQAVAGERAGADLAAIETMSDLAELRAAILAVRENTKLPVLATMTFNSSGRTFLGVAPEDFAAAAEELGAVAVGLNCSLAPEAMLSAAQKIAGATALPLIIKPNAGLPNADGVYGVTPEDFARRMTPFAAIGAKIVGGCCGTTPDFIRALRGAFSQLTPTR